MVADAALVSKHNVQATVFSDGKPVTDDAQFISISVSKELNRIPRARIVFDDGEIDRQDFPVSNRKLFRPGAKITINAGYGKEQKQVFDGIVVRLSVKLTHGNYSRLVVECRDRAVAMTAGRSNANFVDATDSEVMSQLVGKYSEAGLKASIHATTYKHRELVQYYCTDWDFLMSRAEMAGQIVNVEAGEVKTAVPESGKPVLNVGWGSGLMELHSDVDARTQYASVKTVSWDMQTQAVVTGSSTPVAVCRQGDLDADTLAKGIGNREFLLQTTTLGDKALLDDWAKSQQTKAALARLRGRVKFAGSAEVFPGCTLELEGVGKRFSGPVYVSAIRHEIAAGNWVTEAEYGMSPAWFTERDDVMAAAAAGATPGVAGLQIGIVKKLDEDPDGEFRIQVEVPVMQAETAGVWARLASFYGSKGFGARFVPEVGDEVVLGYFNQDPASPVVLGSLYSAARKPPFVEGGQKSFDAKNLKKGLLTSKELAMEFDEDELSIRLATPGENSVVLSDDKKSILLTDSKGNTVEMGESGIALTSKSDIVIDAKGSVTIKGSGGVDVGTQAANTAIKGLRVDIN